MIYSDFSKLVKEDIRFNDFRDMFMHEPLLRFVHAEKSILGPVSEKRIFFNEWNNQEGGIDHATDVVLDDCYGVFTPFKLKGVWIPLSAGNHYSIARDLRQLPIIRTNNGQEECLFFIHPKSESVFYELLDLYRSESITLSALSLSSPRSLLVALPNSHGGFDPLLVKVSLNQYAHGVLRLLYERECALSVVNTSIFRRILDRRSHIPLDIFEDTFSFVPKISSGYSYGMSYRVLPDILNPSKLAYTEQKFIIPLLAFYGQRNADFFKFVIQANGGNVTKFFSLFFQMYLSSFLPLLLDNQLSMEAHGQNLLLIFDKNFQLERLQYRDMGGVNTEIREDDYALPRELRRPELSYFANHITDAAKALEHLFVWRGLFPLTKQVVKYAEHFRLQDPDFDAWYNNCLRMNPSTNVLGNWTDGDSTSDLHIENLSVTGFYRYGYVETLFGKELIEYLSNNNILDDKDINSLYDNLMFPERLANLEIDVWVAPCTYRTFFDVTIGKIINSQSKENIYSL